MHLPVRMARPTWMAAVAAVFVVGCADAEPPLASKAIEKLPTHMLALSGNPQMVAAVRMAEERYYPVLAFHSEAMHRAMAETRNWSAARRRNPMAKCDLAMRVVSGMRAEYEELGRVAGNSGALEGAIQSGLRMSNVCASYVAGPRSMSVFATGGVKPLSIAGAASLTSLSYYTDQIPSKVGTTGDYLGTIIDRLDTLLADGYSNLNSSDFDALVAHAQFTVGDLADLQTSYNSGGWVPSDPPENEMSIFAGSSAKFQWWSQLWNAVRNLLTNPTVQAVVLTDLACFAGTWGAGPQAAGTIAAICSIAAM